MDSMMVGSMDAYLDEMATMTEYTMDSRSAARSAYTAADDLADSRVESLADETVGTMADDLVVVMAESTVRH